MPRDHYRRNRLWPHVRSHTLHQSRRCVEGVVNYSMAIGATLLLGACATARPRVLVSPPLVHVGGTATCALREVGQAMCWGVTTGSRVGGRVVQAPEPLRSLEAGVFQTCALSASGATLCTEGLGGSPRENCRGEFCLGPLRETPATFVQLSTGYYHACGLDSKGSAWCWGGNGMGQVGNAQRAPDPGASGGERVTKPTRVAGRHAFHHISAGEMHTCALTRRGEAYCWGYGQSGELGRDTVMTYCSGEVPLQNAPCSVDRPVRVVTEIRFTRISAGIRLTCGLSTDSSVWCWGSNARCALGTCGADSPVPVRIPLPSPVLSVDAGYWSACAITVDHRAYCWGNNATGQLGSLASSPGGVCFSGGMCTPSPTEVGGNHRWRSISAGEMHTCGVRTDGEVLCWGATKEGRLAGYGATELCVNASTTWRDEPCASAPVLIPRTPPAR